MESRHVKFYESGTKWSKSCPVMIPLAQKVFEHVKNLKFKTLRDVKNFPETSYIS